MQIAAIPPLYTAAHDTTGEIVKQHIIDSVSALPADRPASPTTPAPVSDFDLNPAARPSRSLTPAAVLVPLVERDGGLQVLLTQRTSHLRDHPGQISFPGGRIETGDSGPVAAALRETEEEVGITSRFITPCGCLDDYETSTGYRVTPVVGFVRTGFELRPDSFEVADVFEVPLQFLLADGNCQTHDYLRGGERRYYYVFEYGPRYIWGATAGMLVNLIRRIRGEPAGSYRPAPPATASGEHGN